jgi:hypothetical protein
LPDCASANSGNNKPELAAPTKAALRDKTNRREGEVVMGISFEDALCCISTGKKARQNP